MLYLVLCWLLLLSIASSFSMKSLRRPSWHLLLAKRRTTSMAAATGMMIPCDEDGLAWASTQLRKGLLVAFPTETVYGLGAHALNSSAVASVFHAKGRPTSDPLIVHIHMGTDIKELFDFEQKQAELVCRALTTAFWPGPLTIVHKAQAAVPSIVTANSGYVGIRSPSHPLAQRLLQVADIPIAAPSANRFGHVSPTTAEHVHDDLSSSPVPVYILRDNEKKTDGCKIGIESTVCHVSNDGTELRVLRCGAITSSQLVSCLQSAHLKASVVVDNKRNQIKAHTKSKDENIGNSTDSVVVPGQMVKHYAPDLPTYTLTDLDQTSALANQANYELVDLSRELNAFAVNAQLTSAKLQSAMIIDFGQQLKSLSDRCALYVDLSPEGDVEEACNKLFRYLRMSESAETRETGVSHVLLVDTNHILSSKDSSANPKLELLHALSERLHRASSGIKVRLR